MMRWLMLGNPGLDLFSGKFTLGNFLLVVRIRVWMIIDHSLLLDSNGCDVCMRTIQLLFPVSS